MKKLLSILLILVLMAGTFTACSGRDKEESEPDGGNASDDVDRGNAYATPSTADAAENNQSLDEATVNLVQFQAVKSDDPIAVIKTSMGDIRIRLFPEQAPNAVANFIGLAEEGYYNGKVFHRVIEEFMIQTGSGDNNGIGGKSIFTDADGNVTPFDDEFSTDLWNFRGAVSMANSGTNTNLSQFFIVQNTKVSDAIVQQMEDAQFPAKVVERYKENGGTPHLDWRHTVFGHVIDGMDVVDAIAAVETDEGDKPLQDIIIESVVIESGGGADAANTDADDDAGADTNEE